MKTTKPARKGDQRHAAHCLGAHDIRDCVCHVTAKPRELVSPFNYSHPDSRCAAHVSPSGRVLSHKFKTTERKLVRSGVFATRMTCQHCGSCVNGIEDYTVTASIFSLPR